MEGKPYEFHFPHRRIVLGADEKRHGIISMQVGNERRELIRDPLFGLNMYRLMSGGRLMGIARDEPFRVTDTSNRAVALEWTPTGAHPCHMKVTYALAHADVVDVTVDVKAIQPLKQYEISVSSYFDFSLEPYGVIASWPGKQEESALRLLKITDHPYIKGYYFCLPRDQQAAHTRMDGRWFNHDTNQTIAHFVVGPYYGRPITIMATKDMYVIQMTEPEQCHALDLTYASDDHSDSIMRHNATYHTLFGDDLQAGDTRRARMRQVLCQGEVNLSTVLDIYRGFLDHCQSKMRRSR